ncbi:hypothetical protein WJX72_007953 [[Myrmecia] bisecta]|uniref:Uncharacterized protein n=1 Tax=[Myrmecia] bisecta TaxID=41462 RepID=A0AAW1R8B7_9CHLO
MAAQVLANCQRPLTSRQPVTCNRAKPSPTAVCSLRTPPSPQVDLHRAQFLGHYGAAQPCSRCSSGMVTEAASVSDASTSQKLVDQDLTPILNAQGLIQPVIPEGTQASVFAIYDDKKKLQYVGFSKDLYNSLRTVFSRRPDKAFFYKVCHLNRLDQQEMIDLRTAWFEECGGPPPGNKLAMERNLWQQPVEAGAISARGRQQAAEAEVVTLMVVITSRGCNEVFVPNPELLAKGQVDFLPATAMTPEELEKQREMLSKMAKATSVVSTVIDGEPATFQIFFQRAMKTNGGYMFDLKINFEEKDTIHRVIVGAEYYDAFGITAEQMVEKTFAFLLAKKLPRRTEGILLSSQFPMNYFSISEVEQMFPDFADWFADQGKLPGDDKFWRFNRIHDYGSVKEDPNVYENRAARA